MRLIFALITLLCVHPLLGEETSLKEIRFNRDVLPILSDNCFACHGPDAHDRQAGLRLDVREDAIDYGALVEGDADESELIARIESDDPDLIMPPPDAHKTLTSAQKSLLRRWIAQGAEYEPHWAYAPVQRFEPPDVSIDDRPVTHGVDAFILDRLSRQGLAPSGQADRSALIRRLSLDLIGLPPTPSEVSDFVNDPSPRAYESLVDRLLASPHYGERMAIPWLDVVRYADTVGFHGDQNQNAWAYRDYVIEAFNKNKPFDQFTIEQLAGDLLPDPSEESLTATCFNRLNMMTREGGAQPKEYLSKYAADRVRTVATAWLGSTFGCAECHDHKFDPISAKDFYSLAAFFADIKQWGVYSDYPYTPNPDLSGFNNDYPFPPEITVTSGYLMQRIERLHQQRLQRVAQAAEQRVGDKKTAEALADWKRRTEAFLADHPDGWAVATPTTTRAADLKPNRKHADADPEVDPAQAILLSAKDAADGEIDLEIPPGELTAVRLEILPQEDQAGSIIRGGELASGSVKASWYIRRGKTKEDAKASKPQSIAIRHALADSAKPVYRSGEEVIGIQAGWTTLAQRATEPHTSIWIPRVPLSLGPDDHLVLKLEKNSFARIRVSVSPLAVLDVGEPDQLAAIDRQWLRGGAAPSCATGIEHFIRATGALADVREELAKIDQEILECRGGRTPVLVTQAVDPTVVRILPRGNWQDDSGEIVTPQTPHFLSGPPPSDQRMTRLDLAQWLVSPENPLTSRVVVNRLWQQFFGKGLSLRADDFGAQGEAPSHPELLDYLASELQASGWNIKHLVKLLVTSATYRQESHPSPAAIKKDPENRLLSYHPPRRLEAEIIRDNALAIAGVLNLDQGGPPVKPYQPEGHYANLQFPNRNYVAQSDDRQYRRGVYVHWQRTFLHPMLLNFGAPTREDCIAARASANTPQQALTLLNDPSFVEAAKLFALQLLTHSEAGSNGDSHEDTRPAAVDDSARLDLAYRRSLARPVKDAERESMLALLAQLREHYAEQSEDAGKLIRVGLGTPRDDVDPVQWAAWTNLCRVILNLNETITRY